MAKIMLVEDDNNLREIYEARLLAEGYEIVSAKDGEEALALAIKEKPDLIISDVMMPKISGFDMLDILRSTAETKDTKVIMMTALSQAEDKARADKLGADRYLVKSQVTLEDVAKVAHDVLAGEDSTAGAMSTPLTGTPAPAITVDTPIASEPAEPTTTPDPVTPQSYPVLEEPVATTPAEPPTAEEPEDASAPAYPVAPAPDSATNDTEESDPVAVGTPETPITMPTAESAPANVAETPTEPTTAPAEPTGIKNDLTQTTAEEEKAIESQIDAIFAEPVDTDVEQPSTVTPPPDMSGSDVQTPEVPTGAEPTTEPVTEQPVAEEPTSTYIPVTETIEPAEPPVAPAPFEPAQEASPGSVPVMGKKIIRPINDMTKGPNINELLAKEDSNAGVPSTPATSVISPGGQTVIPITTDVPTTPQQPSNIIKPGDIAL